MLGMNTASALYRRLRCSSRAAMAWVQSGRLTVRSKRTLLAAVTDGPPKCSRNVGVIELSNASLIALVKCVRN